jgi:signal transduction histidine kinase
MQELKERAIENARLYEAIRQLNARKDEFIGVAGHELRTLITTIKGIKEEKRVVMAVRDWVSAYISHMRSCNVTAAPSG